MLLLMFLSLSFLLPLIPIASLSVEPTLIKVGPVERNFVGIPPNSYIYYQEPTTVDAVTVSLSKKNPVDANTQWSYGYVRNTYYWIEIWNNDYRSVDVYFLVTFWYY